MTTTGIAILVVTIVSFVGLGVFGVWKLVHIPWPAGPRTKRTTALGNEVVVIDAPGPLEDDKLQLIDACSKATVAIFTAWRVWRPNDVDGAKVFPVIGVHFIDEEAMEQVQNAKLGGRPIAAYLSDASTAFDKIPLAVIRKSHAAEVIATGQPLMHEILHALLHHFMPDAPGIGDHSHSAWDLVLSAANNTYRELYAKEA